MLADEKKYSLDEIATDLAVDIETVRRLVRGRALPALRVGRKYMVTSSQYEKYLQARTTIARPGRPTK